MKHISLLLCLALLTACQSKPDGSGATNDSTAVSDDDTLATTLSTEGPQTSPDNFVLIPGEQAGVVRANTSEAQLIQILGAENVTKADTVWGAEGDFYIGTTLFKGTPDQAQIIWKDEQHTRPEMVLIEADAAEIGKAVPTASASRWATPEGLRIGSTLKEVEKLNGRAFSLYGFDWDYGGNVSSWQTGKLQDPDGKVYLNVQFAAGALSPAQEQSYQTVSGDGEFSSANPVMQRLNPTVQSISLSFR
ncbi:hypothetical protein [Rudanella lutea]|uniref:hypothetical protein n=1 Tax=Rudanella lutea TaxID=451374 RepID=UPI00037DAB53|nr:hypothetical protein [Rudanella lutea]